MKTLLNYRRLLKNKTDLLFEYKKLTEQVHTFWNQKNSRELTACMKERGRLINKINCIDHTLMQQGVYIHPAAGDDEEKDAIAGMFKELEELLNDISAAETECTHLVRTEWETIKRDLLAARQNRKRTKGYHYAAAAPARYVDTRIT